jgi:hypothetical protein
MTDWERFLEAHPDIAQAGVGVVGVAKHAFLSGREVGYDKGYLDAKMAFDTEG